MLAAVLDARANFCKKYPHLARSNREWPKVVATKIMQLSGGNTFANLGLLKKTSLLFDISFKNPNFAHKLPPDNCITSVATTLGQSRSLLGRAWVSFPEFCPFQSDFRTCNLEGLCPFKSLSSEKPEISTFKLQVRKVGLRRTNSSKRYPRPPQ